MLEPTKPLTVETAKTGSSEVIQEKQHQGNHFNYLYFFQQF